MTWYTLTILATLCYGVQNFLFKISGAKNYNSAITSLSFMITVTILSLIFILIKGTIWDNIGILMVLSVFNAITFFVTSIARMEAMKSIDASIAHPIIRMSTVLVVIFGIFYFKESLGLFQILGIILTLTVFGLLHFENNKNGKLKEKKISKGIILIIISLIFSALTTIVCKFASIMVDDFQFIFISYFFNIFLSLISIQRLNTNGAENSTNKALFLGTMIGICNFIGFSLIMQALSIGPLSMVSTINSMYFIITIILSIVFFKEKLNLPRFISTILSIIATILMKL